MNIIIFSLGFFWFCVLADGRHEDHPPVCTQGKPGAKANKVAYEYNAYDVGSADRVTLAGIFPIHEDGCQAILKTKNYNGFQRMEAMTFALDMVNALVRKGRRKVAIDGYLLDSCSNAVSAIDAVLTARRKKGKLAGLVGASYSFVSTAISTVLQTYSVTMLSYASTAVGLSDKSKHPFFGRLLPSDVGQAEVVYDLIKKLGWKTVEVLTAQREYSESLKREFRRILEENGDENLFCGTHV